MILKIKLLSLLTFLLVFTGLPAQTKATGKLSVGFNLIKNEYVGDLGVGIFDFSKIHLAMGLDAAYSLNSFFSAGAGLSFGQYGYEIQDSNKRLNTSGNPLYVFPERFYGLKLDMQVLGYFKFNNGLILPEDSKIAPYIAAGVGFATFFEDPAKKATGVPPHEWPMIIVGGIDLIIPVGVGVAWKINDKLALKYTFLYNITASENADIRDETMGVNYKFPIENTTNDCFGKQMLGISYNF